MALWSAETMLAPVVPVHAAVGTDVVFRMPKCPPAVPSPLIAETFVLVAY